ncbi:lipopolysaccharide biosynthesis protein [Devosia albogilva]|uniref:Lipopolysaccharide biosynthesis protein n=1 Tax=Devosia albogilva TaxID=429726 RepID=A0ABW5QGR3_9HYPH
MSETRKGALAAALTVLVRAGSAALTFGLQILLARLMPLEDYGGYVAVWTWMLALGSFAALGFAESSIRFLPRYQLLGRGSAIHGYWRLALRAIGAAAVPLVLGAVLLAWLLGFDTAGGMTVLLIGLGLPLLAAEYFFEGVGRSFGWFGLATVPVYLVRPLLIGGLCVGLAWFGVELTLPVVGAVLLVAMALVTAGVGTVLVMRLRGFGRDGAVGRRQRRVWVAAALPLLLVSGLEDLTSYADLLVLSLMLPAETLGPYFAAARTLALAGFVSYAATLVAGRRFALDLAGRDRAELQRSVSRSTGATLWATVVAVVVAWAAGPLLLRLFGPEFTGAQGVLLLLGVGMIAKAASGQAAELLVVAGRQREAMSLGAVVLGVQLGLCVALVPLWGVAGAAAGMALGMAVRSALLGWLVWRLERIRVWSAAVPRLRAA